MQPRMSVHDQIATLARMERQTVAFAVEDHGAKTMWADLVLGLEHLAVLGRDGGFGLFEAALDVQVDERTVIAGFVLRRDKQTPAGLFSFGGKQADPEAGILLQLDCLPRTVE